MEKDKPIKINSMLFFVFLSYVLFMWLLEVMDFICFLGNWPQATVSSRIIALSGFIVGEIYIIKKTEIRSIKLDMETLIGVILILTIGGLEGVYPDSAFDTYNYHLIAQSPGFVNYFVDHFGKGNFQVWGFRLGDRLFYPFRLLLGYRAGTILNTFVLILIYFQIFDLLKEFSDGGAKKNIAMKFVTNRSLWAIMIVLVQHIIYMLGIYYVDILPLPIGIEVVRRLLDAVDKEQRTSDILFYAFLNGLWFAFKMTYIVFVAPCVILYVIIILIRKQMSLRTFIFSGVLAAIPCSIYLAFAYISTGNPVFPYYNSIFKSQLFRDMNFRDERWGPVTVFEKLFWLFYSIVRPEYRQSEIPEKYTFIFAIGACGLIITLILCVSKLIQRQYILRKIDLVMLLLIMSALFWSFTTGYSRYFLMGMLLLGIMAYYLVNRIACINRFKTLNIVCVAAMLVILCQSGLIVKDYWGGRGWSWKRIEKNSLVCQMPYILKDRQFAENTDLEIDMFFVTEPQYTGLAHMYDPNIYTYNASYRNTVSETNIADKALSEHRNLLNGNVYDIRVRNLYNIEDYIADVNAYGMWIDSCMNFTANMGDYLLIKLRKSNLENKVSLSTDNIGIKCEDKYERGTINFICGRVVAGNKEGQVEMVITQNGEEVYRDDVNEAAINSYAIELQDVNKGDMIDIQFYDLSGNLINEEGNIYFVLNPYICEEE